MCNMCLCGEKILSFRLIRKNEKYTRMHFTFRLADFAFHNGKGMEAWRLGSGEARENEIPSLQVALPDHPQGNANK